MAEGRIRPHRHRPLTDGYAVRVALAEPERPAVVVDVDVDFLYRDHGF